MQNLAKIDYMTELETNCATSLAPDRLSEPEPEFVNVSGAQELILPTYVAWRAGTITLCRTEIEFLEIDSGALSTLKNSSSGQRHFYPGSC